MLFHLALLFAQLVQRFGDPRRLDPRTAVVGNILFAALHVFFVETKACEGCAMKGMTTVGGGVGGLRLGRVGLVVEGGVAWFDDVGWVAGRRGVPECVGLF
jgi:hypothetical protein